jgi:nitrate/nitrite-specific signal transduction histidine kinase
MDTAKLVRARMFLNRRKDMENVELEKIAKILNKMADDLRVANEKMDRVEKTAREASTSAAFLVKTVLGDRND